MRRTLYSGLLLLGALSGCLRAPPPAALEFGSDPRIFRGAYETELDLRVASPEVSLSADASLLAMGNGDFFHAVQFWDTVSARPLGTLEAGVRVDAVTLTRAGDRVAAVIPDPHDDGPGGCASGRSQAARWCTTCRPTPRLAPRAACGALRSRPTRRCSRS